MPLSVKHEMWNGMECGMEWNVEWNGMWNGTWNRCKCRNQSMTGVNVNWGEC